MKEISHLLAAGGRIYVCGRATTVGKGVDDALEKILSKHPPADLNGRSVQEYLLGMREDYRYAIVACVRACVFGED